MITNPYYIRIPGTEQRFAAKYIKEIFDANPELHSYRFQVGAMEIETVGLGDVFESNYDVIRDYSTEKIIKTIEKDETFFARIRDLIQKEVIQTIKNQQRHGGLLNCGQSSPKGTEYFFIRGPFETSFWVDKIIEVHVNSLACETVIPFGVASNAVFRITNGNRTKEKRKFGDLDMSKWANWKISAEDYQRLIRLSKSYSSYLSYLNDNV